MGYRSKCFEAHGDRCFVCDKEADVAHHINGNRTNHDVDNLAPLCYSCHQRIHSSNVDVPEWEQEPPSIAPPGKIENSNDTTITISEWSKEKLDKYRADGVTWSEYTLWLLQQAVEDGPRNKGGSSIPASDEVRERLQSYRGPWHDSWNDVLNGMMDILPSTEQFSDGCTNCGKNVLAFGSPENVSGTIQYFNVDHEGVEYTQTVFYCSAECAMEAQEEMEKHVPESPDKVIVGGKSEMRTEFSDASFYIDRDTMEVGLDIPGAFAGESSHDYEYDYTGEPVYVWNEGAVRQKGVIEDIIHEEKHTALMLEHDVETTMLNHPNEEKREEYKEKHAKWTEEDCAQCGSTLKYMAKEPPEKCPYCNATEW